MTRAVGTSPVLRLRKELGDITAVITPTSTVTMKMAFTSGTGSSTEAR